MIALIKVMVAGIFLPFWIPLLFHIHLCEAQTDPFACTPSTCKLPDCLCAGTTIPGGLTAKETPQMVVFTFDDAVNEEVLPLKELFPKERTNPNGSPISMTLFVSHDYTDYCLLAEFYRNNHEVASHSITHREPISFWKDAPYNDYENEIEGQRLLMTHLAGIPMNEIKGYRSPFIQPGGDTQFTVIQDFNFTYDSSLLLVTQPGGDRVWPYTLDFPYQVACGIEPCPSKPFKGIWELPIQPIPDHTGQLCSFLDRCMEATQEEQVYGYLRRSFESCYNTTRAPLILNMHAYWYNDNPYGLNATHRFIGDLLDLYDDVYFITATQLVEWLRTPTPLSKIKDFKPWLSTEKTTQTCSKAMMKIGKNRTKRSDFKGYKSKVMTLYDTVSAPKDGGRTMLGVTFLAFLAGFIYLQIVEGQE